MKYSLISAVVALFTLSATPAFAQGADPVNRGPLNVFSREQLHCGKGVRFRGLIWGDRPLSVCMVKVRRQGFGGPL